MEEILNKFQPVRAAVQKVNPSSREMWGKCIYATECVAIAFMDSSTGRSIEGYVIVSAEMEQKFRESAESMYPKHFNLKLPPATKIDSSDITGYFSYDSSDSDASSYMGVWREIK